MQKIHFIKVQGTGNDFILIDNLDGKLDTINLTQKYIEKICHRNFGIGADGVLIIEKSQIAEFNYIMYNSDGSKAEMCGNGIRCYMLYLVKRGLIKGNKTNVETGRGILDLELNNGLFQVSMGSPIFKSNAQFSKVGLNEIESYGRKFHFNFISMGNPHCIIFLDSGEDLSRFELEKYGKPIENNLEYFPQRINTEFVKVIDSCHGILRVWERGCGETLSCGTGVCASVVAGVLNGYFEKGKDIEIQIKGGKLVINWSGNLEDSVIMKGPADIVFEGVIDV